MAKLVYLRGFTGRVRQYLRNEAAISNDSRNKEVQIYADEEETREIDLLHKKSIVLLEEVLGDLEDLNPKRAIDIAAGDGRAIKDLLQHHFEAIDCFDQCPVAVKKLEKLQQTIYAIKKVDQARM